MIPAPIRITRGSPPPPIAGHSIVSGTEARTAIKAIGGITKSGGRVLRYAGPAQANGGVDGLLRGILTRRRPTTYAVDELRNLLAASPITWTHRHRHQA
jgi:hypothetical protein